MIRRFLLAMVVACALPAHADEAIDDAHRAAIADCLTTGIGIAAGLAELNPVGPLLSCTLKPLAIRAANAQPEPRRTSNLHVVDAMWKGAAFNNIAAVLGATSVPAIGIGIVVGWWVWSQGADEREFMEICADQRSRNPALACVYTPA
jgi:hypothetical protein